MKGRTSRYAFIAVTLAIAAGILTFFYLNSIRANEANKVQAKLASFVNKEKVVVAKKSISAGAVITESDVVIENILTAYINPQAISSLDEVVGKNALVDIYEGEQIARGRVGSPESVPVASRTISGDKVAVAVAVDEVSGVGGGIKPGDHVDVMVTYEEGSVTELLYTNILVRGVGGTYPYGGEAPSETKKTGSGFGGTESPKEEAPTTVILEVTRQQAKDITFASEKGKLRLALLPAAED